MLLAGKTAVVAGIGPGLGRATALALAQNGADVALVARSGALLEPLRAEIERLGRRALGVQGSIADAGFCQGFAARLADAWGGADILVNNAFSQGNPGPVMQADLDEWRQVFDVNLFGSLHMTRALAPAMAQRAAAGREGGSIVMVNSDQAWRTVPGFAAYSASKAALVNVTRALAMELGPQNIRVNSYHPGMIKGPPLIGYFQMLAAQSGTTAEAIERDIAGRAALGFIPEPEDLAGTIVFLASALSRPITGQSIAADGGQWFH